MKTYAVTLSQTSRWWLALASIVASIGLQAAEAEDPAGHSSSSRVTISKGGGGAGNVVVEAIGDGDAVQISSIEPATGAGRLAPKDRTWLGVAIEEGSEALAAQLGLAPGAGLVVTYVAPDSPAAKAGLQKNDVLVELDGQLLVVPAQLRKLVQVRKADDTIDLVFYRAGKKQSASATLGKAPAGFGLFDEANPWDGEPRLWLNPRRDALGQSSLDVPKLQEQVRRSIEQTRKAMAEALRASSNTALAPALKRLRELRQPGMDVDNNASVTVRSTGDRVKSIVKADESGTIVIVCNPTPHLTAHDKDGKLLFDDEIDTPDQRAKVPQDLWKKVEPMLKKLTAKAEEDREEPSASGKGSSSLRQRPVSPTPPSGSSTL